MTTTIADHPRQAAPARTLPARLRLALADIKLAHSVFALPFALMGAVLASRAFRPDTIDGGGKKRFLAQLFLVVACMVFARTWAMLVNRIADRRFDARNPRTARRALASGALSRRDAAALAVLSAGAFVVACAGFYVLDRNTWPVALSVPVLLWIAFYSYTKRFTALSHLFLGAALAASPLAAAIAVNPGALADTPALWWIALMVMLWVAGFDVLYALQDERFDRETGLHSLPAARGARAAALVSRAMHLLALVALVFGWMMEPRLGALYLGALAVVALLLVLEHAVLARRGLDALPVAFFTINGVVSVLLALAAIADVVLADRAAL